jgi:septum formation protein
MRKKIILASASKRRARILQETGIPFTIEVSHVEEVAPENDTPRNNVIVNARLKAHAVARNHRSGLVLGVDTVVSFREHIIGKPRDLKEADSFLKKFSGKSLTVYSGMCLIDAKTNKRVSKVTTTKVRVKKMTARMRAKMLELLDPLDRAGGFSIEGIGSFIFDSVDGSFYNVLGLPTIDLYELFKKMGIDLLDYV